MKQKCMKPQNIISKKEPLLCELMPLLAYNVSYAIRLFMEYGDDMVQQ